MAVDDTWAAMLMVLVDHLGVDIEYVFADVAQGILQLHTDQVRVVAAAGAAQHRGVRRQHLDIRVLEARTARR